MCGIAGALAFEARDFAISTRLIDRMRDALEHRGPDGAGTWLDPSGRVGLGHRRLSIVDLSSAASQPMSNHDGSLWIVFNGEIYNHAAIRNELVSLGHHDWRTDHSDTEVIVRGFEEWGIDVIHRLRGMFAFALWDARTRDLWLVRDRIGVKPLYYSLDGTRLLFGSEPKALLAVWDRPLECDPAGVWSYLSFLATPAPFTVYRGIEKLPAASYMHVRADGYAKVTRYWEPRAVAASSLPTTEDGLAELLLEKLGESVELRKVSDVPVGVFLSGGLDSSANCALFRRGHRGPFKTFTVGYDGSFSGYTDEFEPARIAADSVGAERFERRISFSDFERTLPTIFQYLGEPIADPTAVPNFFVTELARRNEVIVCQVGEGSDELFCGYEAWVDLLHRQRALRHLPRWAIRGLGTGAARSRTTANTFLRERLQCAAAGRPIHWGAALGFNELHKRRLVSPAAQRASGCPSMWDAVEPTWKRFEAGNLEKSVLNWMTYSELSFRLPELLLARADRMTMAFGVEARVPFLDHQFVEFVLGIPEHRKLPGKAPKHLFRKAITGLIPDELLRRRKQGFGVAPLLRWLKGPYRSAAIAQIDSFARESGLVTREGVGDVQRAGSELRLWTLLNLAMWWNRQFGKSVDVEFASTR